MADYEWARLGNEWDPLRIEWGMADTSYNQVSCEGPKEAVCEKKESNVNKLSLIAKKLFDKDTKALIEAGVLNEGLEVKDEDFVMEFLVSKFKEELAVAAREKLDEEKATNKK